MTKLPLPNESCILCGKTIGEIRGKMIRSTPAIGIYVFSDKNRLSNKFNRNQKVIMISREPYLAIAYWGNSWTEDSINRAVEIVKEGKVPWICQPCAGRICSKCGGIVHPLPAAELFDEEGKQTYCGVLPLIPKCENGCE